MLDKPPKRKFDPRSPVQPGHNPAPYFVAAAVLAVAIWTFQQNRIQDSNPDAGGAASAPRAEQPTGPTPATGEVRALFSSDDYPVTAQRAGEQGMVRARLDVDRKGRVGRCSIVHSSGHASLDRATCAILQRRARFAPARDVNGKPVADSVVTPEIIWRLEG